MTDVDKLIEQAKERVERQIEAHYLWECIQMRWRWWYANYTQIIEPVRVHGMGAFCLSSDGRRMVHVKEEAFSVGVLPFSYDMDTEYLKLSDEKWREMRKEWHAEFIYPLANHFGIDTDRLR